MKLKQQFYKEDFTSHLPQKMLVKEIDVKKSDSSNSPSSGENLYVPGAICNLIM